MSKTLLNGVNDVLKRLDLLDADSGVLTTLTDSARQNWIDTIIQLWNEGLDELYSRHGSPKPKSMTEGTITLVTGTRAYTLATDMAVFLRRLHLYDSTNNHYITFLEDSGFEQIQLSDPEEDDTGLPSFAFIDPEDNKILMNRTPTAAENGRVYRYFYQKDLELTLAADTFPFTDTVYRAMIPAVAQLWRRDNVTDFDPGIFAASIARAAFYLSQAPLRRSWSPQPGRAAPTGTDRPFDP